MALRSDSALLLTRNNQQKLREDEEKKRKAEALAIEDGITVSYAKFQLRRKIQRDYQASLSKIQSLQQSCQDPFLAQQLSKFIADTTRIMRDNFSTTDLKAMALLEKVMNTTTRVADTLENIVLKKIDYKLQDNCNKIKEFAIEMGKESAQENKDYGWNLAILATTLTIVGMGIMLISLAAGPFALFGIGVGATLMTIGSCAMLYDLYHMSANKKTSLSSSANHLADAMIATTKKKPTSKLSGAFNSVVNFFKPKAVNQKIEQQQELSPATQEFLAWRAVK